MRPNWFLCVFLYFGVSLLAFGAKGICRLLLHEAVSRASLGFVSVPPYLRGYKQHGLIYIRDLKDVARGRWLSVFNGYVKTTNRSIDIFAGKEGMSITVKVGLGGRGFSKEGLEAMKNKYGEGLEITTRSQRYPAEEVTFRIEKVDDTFDEKAGSLFEELTQ